MNKFVSIVADIASALTLVIGTTMAASTEFWALQNVSSSSINRMTESELGTVVGGWTDDQNRDQDQDKKDPDLIHKGLDVTTAYEGRACGQCPKGPKGYR